MICSRVANTLEHYNSTDLDLSPSCWIHCPTAAAAVCQSLAQLCPVHVLAAPSAPVVVSLDVVAEPAAMPATAGISLAVVLAHECGAVPANPDLRLQRFTPIADY
jgi:hypothetical protein